MYAPRPGKSDPLADIVVRNVPPSVMSTLSEEQIKGVRAAVEKSRRHLVDLRFRVPLPFSSYYAVFLFGQDTRRETVSVEDERRSRFGTGARSWCGALLYAGLFIFVLGLLYVIKSRLGIDLFKSHLRDFLPFLH